MPGDRVCRSASTGHNIWGTVTEPKSGVKRDGGYVWAIWDDQPGWPLFLPVGSICAYELHRLDCAECGDRIEEVDFLCAKCRAALQSAEPDVRVESPG